MAVRLSLWVVALTTLVSLRGAAGLSTSENFSGRLLKLDKANASPQRLVPRTSFVTPPVTSVGNSVASHTVSSGQNVLKSPRREGDHVPTVSWSIRVENPKGTGKHEWSTLTSDEVFKNKRVVVFSLPGAFTPTCTTKHLPDFERKYQEVRKLGVDEVYCLSVNDSFVMNAWAKQQKLQNVKVIPDGNAQFTKEMGFLVNKENLGFGNRAWRYTIVANDGIIEKVLQEPGMMHNTSEDPFTVSDVQSVIAFLTSKKSPRLN
eukprot:GHVT01056570.1.p1 GENE.GHVT01056570.1~~GHVT01056570.1.p1  ORF type:complete len:261 (-),score=27.04 GHVT01056570.1:532-1314(-)